MEKKTRDTEAMMKPVGYVLGVLGALMAVIFFALNTMTFVSGFVIDAMGGAGSILEGNIGTFMWIGILTLVVGAGLVLIEETKEEEEPS